MKVILFLENHQDPSAISFIGDHLREFKDMGCKIFHQENSEDILTYYKKLTLRLRLLGSILGEDYIEEISSELILNEKLKGIEEVYEGVIKRIENLDGEAKINNFRKQSFIKYFTDKAFLFRLLRVVKGFNANMETMRYAEDLGLVVNPIDYSGGMELSQKEKDRCKSKIDQLKSHYEKEDHILIENKRQQLSDELYSSINNNRLDCQDIKNKIKGFMEFYEKDIGQLRNKKLEMMKSLYERNYLMVQHIICQSKYHPLTIAVNGSDHGEGMKHLLEEEGYDVLSICIYDNSLYAADSYDFKRNNERATNSDPLENRLVVDVNDKKSYDSLMDKITDFVNKEVGVSSKVNEIQSVESISQQRRGV